MNSQSAKVQQFLSGENTKNLIKTMYQLHTRDGGTLPLATFTEQIPFLQRSWKELPRLDSYESIAMDPTAEMAYINKKFITVYSPMFEVAQDYRVKKERLDTVESYRQMDTGPSEPVPFFREQSIVHDKVNTIDVRWDTRGRHYDDKFTDRSREFSERDPGSRYDMAAVHETTSRPYATAEDLDVRYLGVPRDDSNLQLMSTRWKTG